MTPRKRAPGDAGTPDLTFNFAAVPLTIREAGQLRPALGPDDVEQLLRFHVEPAQIEALQATLPFTRLWMKRGLRLNDLRKKFERAHAAASEMGEATRLLMKPDAGDDGHVMWTLVRHNRDAGPSAKVDLGALAEQVAALTAYLSAELGRLEDQPQHRYRANSALPREVDLALRRGAGLQIEEHGRSRSAEDLPKDYKFAPSSNLSSPFYDVVTVCQRAITGWETDPGRAIKAYVRELKDQNGRAGRV
jgi:hypothetical protein